MKINEIELILDESRKYKYKNIDFYTDYLYLFYNKDPSVMKVFKDLLKAKEEGALIISWAVKKEVKNHNIEIHKKVILQLYVKYNFSLEPEEQLKREW